MGDIQWHVFAYIVSKVETPLVTAVDRVINDFLNYIAAPLKITFVLYIALTGIRIINGNVEESGATLIGRFLKLGIVAYILTGTGMYQYYIYEFFFTTLPLSLSNTLTSSGAAGAVSANSFDIAWLTAWNAGVRVWLTLSWHDIGQEFVILLFWAAAIISSALCFTIWLVSRVFLALYIAIGPLLVASILFPAVRSIFERWIGSLISCVILQITTVILLYIVLSVELDVVNTISAMGSVDAISMIQVLLAGIIFFAVAGYVAYHLPALASSLAGGLHFQADAIARAGKSAASTVLGSTGRTQVDGQGNSSRVGRSGALGLGHFGASNVAKGGRAVYRRIRTPPGGSLSDGG
jgi:type IV secretion system protein VirB6